MKFETLCIIKYNFFLFRGPGAESHRTENVLIFNSAHTIYILSLSAAAVAAAGVFVFWLFFFLFYNKTFFISTRYIISDGASELRRSLARFLNLKQHYKIKRSKQKKIKVYKWIRDIL